MLQARKSPFLLRAVFLLLLVLCFCRAGSAAMADTLALPDGLQSIEAEAFRGDTSLGAVTVPDGTVSIGDYAFADSSLAMISLPSSLTSIGGHAFDGCADLLICAPSGSDALAYARENGIRCAAALTLETSAQASIENSGDIALFSFVAEASGIYSFTSQGTADTYGYLYDGEMNQLASNDDGGENRNFLVSCALTAGTRYFFGARYYSSYQSGTFTVSLDCTVQWDITDDVLTISGSGSMEDLMYSYSWPENIREVVIGEGITTVGSSAFSNCRNLVSVTLPAGLTRIGSRAFYFCGALESINIPDTVTYIGEKAFYNCESLPGISLPNGITYIGAEAFMYCTSLENVSIPTGLTVLYSGTFSYCRCLKSITVPQGVTAIGSEAFYECSSLTSVTLPDGITAIPYEAFGRCSKLQTVNIPQGVTTISNYAFYYCQNLQSLSLPDSVTEIGNYAFSNCTNLESINIPEQVTSIGSSTFSSCRSLTAIQIPAGVTSIGASAFSYCDSLQSVTIPDGVTAISDYTFNSCSSLASVTLPDGLTAIGNSAFRYCSGLSDISLPDGLTTIGESAFSYCKNLHSLVIPASVTSIGKDAFYYCSFKIIFRGNVPAISDGIFSNVILAVYPHGNSTWNADTLLDYGAYKIIWMADNESTAVQDSEKDSSETLNSETSSTAEYQNYGTWSSCVYTYLIPMDDGGLTRVEYTGSAAVVEQYNSQNTLTWKKTISLELPLWGGFFAGADYNFFVFGQTNPNEDNAVEVLRVVRYTKNWHRVDSVSVYGANTTVPFDAGSCRITESGDMLYVHTCHEMYASADGRNHQANMHYDIYVPKMTVVQQNYQVSNSGYDYVSHSFNQFVITDGNDVIKVDHGDAYPRSITLARMKDSAEYISSGTFERITLMSFPGSIGANYTGASVGGLEASGTHYLVAINSIDQSSAGSSSQRNIYVLAANKASLSSDSVSTIKITSYAESASKYVSTPVLVKISASRFLLLWSEGTASYSSSANKVRYVFLNAAGQTASQVYEANARLSDCQPVVRNNKVTWYVTQNSTPVFYSIDLSNPGTISIQ